MSKYLINVTETYRVDSEKEAQELIENAKRDGNYELKKYTSQKKMRKEKKEIVDEWINVTLVKTFTDEKEPESQYEISYNEGSAF